MGAIDTQRTKSKVSAKYKAPKDIHYKLDDAMLSIRYDLSGPMLGKRRTDALALTQIASIDFRPQKTGSLATLKAEFGLLEDLLLLLTDSEYRLGWPTLTGPKKVQCTYYFQRRPSDAKPPEWFQCWTNFPKLRDSFGWVYGAWRKKRSRFSAGFYMYLGTRRGSDLFIEHRFSNLIWGVESLHRKKHPPSEMPAEIAERIQRILGRVDDKKDKKWLNGKLKYAHEPTLEQRIFETFKDLPLSLDVKRLRQFCNACQQIRNDIMHCGGPKEGQNYGEFILELHKKNDALSFLYHAMLLQEIGIDDEILRWWIYEGFQSGRIKMAFVDVDLMPNEERGSVSASAAKPLV